MTAPEQFAVSAPLAPMCSDARISSPMTSQLAAGAIVAVLERRDEWLRVRSEDAYEGWVHIGYLEPATGHELRWRRSLGCVSCEVTGDVRSLPLGARLRPDAEVLDGEAVSPESLTQLFPRNAESIAHTAATRFAGASYLWGGVTPWGCDCSGFVQTVFALHGIALPRDAWQQALVGTTTHAQITDVHSPSDLLFFSDRDDLRVTHVGIALTDGRMVHSALGRGGVAIEQLNATDSYVTRLRTRFTGVQRVL